MCLELTTVKVNKTRLNLLEELALTVNNKGGEYQTSAALIPYQGNCTI